MDDDCAARSPPPGQRLRIMFDRFGLDPTPERSPKRALAERRVIELFAPVPVGARCADMLERSNPRYPRALVTNTKRSLTEYVWIPWAAPLPSGTVRLRVPARTRP